MLAQSGQHFNATDLRLVGLYFNYRGAFQVNLKGDLQIFRFDIHRLIDSPVNDLICLFSLALIRKTQVFSKMLLAL